MGSNERVKDLFYKAFNIALAKNDSRAVTYVGMQYARFLAFKTNEVGRACDLLDQATNVIKNSKILYLSHANLLKHLEGVGIVQPIQEANHQLQEQQTVFSKQCQILGLAPSEKKIVILTRKFYLFMLRT